MQARVRFGIIAGNPLRRSCVKVAATGLREVHSTKFGKDVGLQEPNLCALECGGTHSPNPGSLPFLRHIHIAHASPHLYHTCASTRSLLRIHPLFLSFYISFLSPLYMYIFARSHLQIYLSTSTHLHIYIAPAHPHCHSFTSARWTITCLALGRTEEFEPGAASSDDVTVAVGALFGVSAARQDMSMENIEYLFFTTLNSDCGNNALRCPWRMDGG